MSASSPTVRRASSTTWRDPRLLLGVLIIAVCVVGGTRLFSSADDTVPVWAVREDLPSGASVGSSDLVRTDMRFPGAEQADRYVSAERPVPAGAVVERAVGAGELLPRAALGRADGGPVVEVPISVAPDAVPATVAAGSLVDVWVSPDPASASGRPGRLLEAIRVFEGVRVVAAPVSGGALAPAGTRQVIIAVDETQQSRLAEALAHAAAGSTVITRRG